MELLEFLKAYKEFGVAGLFIMMYLATVWLLIKELKASKKECVDITDRVVTVLDKSANCVDRFSAVMEKVEQGQSDLMTNNKEFIAFFKGRDEQRRH